MSLESFLDDPDAESGRLGAALEARGVAFVDAGSALRAAFDALDVRRVGLLTPYRPEANAMVRRFFTEELGVEVVALRAVDCPTAHAIAEVPEDRLDMEGYLASEELEDGVADCRRFLDLASFFSLAGVEQRLRWLPEPARAPGRAESPR